MMTFVWKYQFYFTNLAPCMYMSHDAIIFICSFFPRATCSKEGLYVLRTDMLIFPGASNAL